MRSVNDRPDRRIITSLAIAIVWTAVLAPDAEAYIDPSAGGMLLQLLLAGTAGAAVLVKLFWARIRRMVGLPDRRADAGGGPAGPHDSRPNDPV